MGRFGNRIGRFVDNFTNSVTGGSDAIEYTVVHRGADSGSFRQCVGSTNLPKLHNIARSANCFRQKTQVLLTRNTYSLTWTTVRYQRTFCKQTLTVDGKRHIILSTPVQLVYLASTKCLFVDETFDVIKAPFTQLYSFHGFLKVGELMKQVPLVFVFMSGKRK